MDKKEEEIWIQGQPISEGIAMGIPFFLDLGAESIPEFPITIGEVDDEITRYRDALISSRHDLQQIEKGLIHEGSEDAADVIATHIQMLDDPIMTTGMEEKIRQMLQNTESVFQTVIGNYAQKYSQMSDHFFQQRLIDVMDLAKRVLRHLCLETQVAVTEIPFNSIVFANTLEPSYTASAPTSRVHAFVTEVGGVSSHAALIARAKGIPYVICPNLQSLRGLQVSSVIVDGKTGDLILNPTMQTLQKYRQKKTCMKTHYQLLQKESHAQTETLDGQQIKVLANIGPLSDLIGFKQSGADGVGLFRSEYLFLEHPNQPPTEEFQYQNYKELIEQVGDKPIVFRVFDVGGDKKLDFLGPMLKEPNPMLGCRGIRFLLHYPVIFRTQLKALFRACRGADVRILLPFVADCDEWMRATQIMAEVLAELSPAPSYIPVGCMIEIPSAVMACGALAERSQFLSIGTNDLFQYTLGADRNNPLVGDAYSPMHPSMLQMIVRVVQEAARFQRSLSVCGEVASRPLYLPLLLGLGITEISCSPRDVPIVKSAIRKLSLASCQALAVKALSMSSSSEITQLLKN